MSCQINGSFASIASPFSADQEIVPNGVHVQWLRKNTNRSIFVTDKLWEINKAIWIVLKGVLPILQHETETLSQLPFHWSETSEIQGNGGLITNEIPSIETVPVVPPQKRKTSGMSEISRELNQGSGVYRRWATVSGTLCAVCAFTDVQRVWRPGGTRMRAIECHDNPDGHFVKHSSFPATPDCFVLSIPLRFILLCTNKNPPPIFEGDSRELWCSLRDLGEWLDRYGARGQWDILRFFEKLRGNLSILRTGTLGSTRVQLFKGTYGTTSRLPSWSVFFFAFRCLNQLVWSPFLQYWLTGSLRLAFE
jgi:hypothetical protein